MGYFDDNNWWNTHVKPITGPLFAPNEWLPSGGADPQDFVYLETMPGAFARRMTNLRTCDPLWPVFGCKVSVDGSHTDVVPWYELPYQFQTEDEDEDGDGDESDEELECKTSDCPPNHIAIKITDADGNETCSCQDTEALGDGITSLGRGLGILALAGVVTTGIIVYGIYRVIRG